MNNNLSQIKLLLPFYVNGTLSVAEQELVAQAISESAELRAELEVIQAQVNTLLMPNIESEQEYRVNQSRLSRLMSIVDEFENDRAGDTIVSKGDKIRPAKSGKKKLARWIIGTILTLPAIGAIALVATYMSYHTLAKQSVQVSLKRAQSQAQFQESLEKTSFKISSFDPISRKIIIYPKTQLSEAEFQNQLAQIKSFNFVESAKPVNDFANSNSKIAPNVCGNYISNGHFKGFIANENVNLGDKFTSIGSISGSLTAEFRNNEITIPMAKNPSPNEWFDGGYGDGKTGNSGGWKDVLIQPNENSNAKFPSFILNIRFGLLDGISPGKTIVPQGNKPLYLVVRNQSDSEPIKITKFNLEICGTAKNSN